MESGRFQMEQMKLMLAEKQRMLEEEQRRMNDTLEKQRQTLEASANAEAEERSNALLEKNAKLKTEQAALLKLRQELDEAKAHLQTEAKDLLTKKKQQEDELAQEKCEVEESRRTLALLKATTLESTVVKVSHPYVSKSVDELTIQPGEVLTVLEKNTDGWWKGRNQASGALGWLPANHVIEEEAAAAASPDDKALTETLHESIVVLKKENADLHLRLHHAGEQLRHMGLEGQHMDARVRMQDERIRELEEKLLNQSLGASSLGMDPTSGYTVAKQNASDNPDAETDASAADVSH